MYSIRTLNTTVQSVRQLLAAAATSASAAAAEQKTPAALVIVFHQQRTFPQTRWQSSAAAPAVASFKALQQKQGKVLSSSAPSNASVGAKGRTLPPYMVFRYCQQNSATGGTGGHTSMQSHSTIAWDMNQAAAAGAGSFTAEMTKVDSIATRPLVLLFGWMLSKNSHLEKYRQFWTSRGYDILTVQTSPFDLLLPSLGGRKVAQNVFNFLTRELVPRYDEVLVHAFSVGGYQLGELLQRLYEGIERGEPEAEQLYRSMKGWLIDSVVFAEDAAPGLSRAITLNPVVQPVLEKSIATFLSATSRFTFARYKLVEANIIDNRREVPAMLLFSKDDVVSNFRSNYAVVDSWQRKGIPTKAQCWDRSSHVLHYKEHPEEYEQAVDGFIRRLDITKAYK
ncbi:hypothetical protein TYRP_018079 [Tyrophagus putrescentiae]|nr:hypothetical protein TYRP_018079 [Tyrophagus putrescentiae]